MENNISVNENKKSGSKTVLVFKIILNVLFYALIIFLFLFSIMNIRGGNGTTDFPNIFGRGFLSVQSDSMERDPTKKIYPEWETYEIGGFSKGDLLNVKTFDKNDAETLKIGDVITYQWTINGEAALNTHRIVHIHRDSSNNIDYFVTQGDKIAQTTKYDPTLTGVMAEALSSTYEAVRVGQIKGVVTSVNSGAGKVLDTIQKNWLFIFVIPIIILLVVEVFLVVRNIMILRGEKNKLELQATKEDIIADEKEKMRQELLAEMRAQGLIPAEDKAQAEEAKPVEETKAEDVSEEKEEEVPTETTESVEETTVVAEPETTEEPQKVESDEIKEETTEATEEVAEEKVEEPEVKEAKEELAPEATESKDNNGQEESKEEVASVEDNKEVTEEVKDEVEEPKEEEKPKKAPAKKSTTTAKKASTTKKTTTKKSTEKAE